MNRRSFARRGLATCAAVLTVTPGVSSELPSEEKAERPPKHYGFRLNQPIPVEMKSAPVTWQGNEYHLLDLNTIQFTLDADRHLSGHIRGRIITFDNVTYSVGAAVFGKGGVLLGTGKRDCKITRLWVGKVLSSAVDLLIDFGTSLNYEHVESFQLCISNHAVQTPDAWQH